MVDGIAVSLVAAHVVEHRSEPVRHIVGPLVRVRVRVRVRVKVEPARQIVSPR